MNDEKSIANWAARLDSEQQRTAPFLPEPGRLDRLVSELGAMGDKSGGSELAGVLFGVKDIINVDGLETRAGSNLPPSTFAGPEASVVTRLRRTGAVVAGKTTTTEFAFSEPSPTRNPRNPAHTPGGSSSGSAAAVGAGLVPFALGTQTVDSIVTPAAYCGVVGFKPTFGRVPVDGVVPFSPSMDHVGVLAQDVATATSVARVICDRWSGEAPNEGIVLGLPSDAYLGKADGAANQALDAVIGEIEGAGFDIVATDALSNIDEIANVHRRLTAAEFARVSEQWFEQFGDRFRPRSREVHLYGASLDPEVVSLGIDHAAGIRERLEEIMERRGISAWVAPAATGVAPRGLDYIGDPIMGRPWTHAHLPVVALPVASGLPLGIQLVGRHGHDEELLALAARVEMLFER